MLSGANRHDTQRATAALDAIPPVAGRVGRPRRRPDSVEGDKGYDSEPLRDEIRDRGIVPLLQHRGDVRERLGRTRWVIERTHAWINQFRHLKIRYEIKDLNFLGFHQLACAIIALRFAA